MKGRRPPLRVLGTNVATLRAQVAQAEGVLRRLKEHLLKLGAKMTERRVPAVNEQMARFEGDLRRLEADMLKLLARIHHAEAQVAPEHERQRHPIRG